MCEATCPKQTTIVFAVTVRGYIARKHMEDLTQRVLDESGLHELVSASILTMPTGEPNQPDVLVRIPLGFGEDLSAEALLRGSLAQNATHAISSQNVISFAEVIKVELQEKQKLIDQLLDENKLKAEALLNCGKDIRSLRESNKDFDHKLAVMDASVQQFRSYLQQLAKDLQITPTPNDNECYDLVARKMMQVFESNNAQQELIHNLQTQITHKDQELQRSSGVQKQYADLQSEHSKIKAFLKTIQSEIRSVESYRKTIQTQEKVIGKLQSIMESKLKSRFTFLKEEPAVIHAPPTPPIKDVLLLNSVTESDYAAADATVTSSSDGNNAKIQELEDKLYQLEQDKSSLEQQLQSALQSKKIQEVEDNSDDIELDDESDSGAASGMVPAGLKNLKKANLRIDQLRAENLSKKFRIEALEKQLEVSSRDSAREIARLRTRLFEMEVALSLSSSEPQVLTIEQNDLTEEMEDIEEILTEKNDAVISNVPSTPSVVIRSRKSSQDTLNSDDDDLDFNIHGSEEAVKLLEAETAAAVDDPLQSILGNISPRTRPSLPARASVVTPVVPRTESIVNVNLDDVNESIIRPTDIREGAMEKVVALYLGQCEDDGALAGIATVLLHYSKMPDGSHMFSLSRIKVENFPSSSVADHQLFCHLCAFTTESSMLFEIETPPVRNAVTMVLWDNDQSGTSFDEERKFSISQERWKLISTDESGLNLRCSLKTRSTNNEVKVIGTGTVSLIYNS